MRTLGNSGIEVSVVGIGCNAFGSRIDADQTRAVVHAALDAGVTFFDTADAYGDGASEELLGAALADRRGEAVIATKFGMSGGASAGHVRASVEASLRRLGTDHIDLYQLHRPDPNTRIEETLGALHELVTDGLVRAVGCSNFQAWQVVDANWRATIHGWSRFATAQNEYSLYNRTAEVELAPACLAQEVGLLPYFPLAYGLLTGKYRRDVEPAAGTRLAHPGQRRRHEGADWQRIDELRAFADARGISLLHLAIGGLAAQPAVASVIAGVTRPEQVHANVRAAEWVPSDDDLVALAQIGAPTQSHTTYA